MKRSNNVRERIEIVRAFKKYARLGLGLRSLNPAQMYKRIDVLCPSRRLKLDMLSVYDTMRLLALEGDVLTLDALSQVYLADLSYRAPDEASALITACARRQFCDERTVYRRLERARSLYSDIRKRQGLLSDVEKSHFGA